MSIPDRCPGPAGLWPCALEFGHPGDHERKTGHAFIACPDQQDGMPHCCWNNDGQIAHECAQQETADIHVGQKQEAQHE